MQASLSALSSQAATQPATSAPRFDMYAFIHKALRSCMTDTLCRVGRVDVDDGADLDATLARLDGLLDFCAGHLRHENDFVHAAIDARLPAGSRRTADDHVEHLEAIADLRDEAQALRDAVPAARPALALRLYRHLALFVADNFQHMHIEETANNAMLWAHYDDAELMAIHGRLLASIAPQEHLTVARWMVPALSPAERAVVVGEARRNAPPQAFAATMQAVRPHLDDAAWRKLAPVAGGAPSVLPQA